MSAFPHIVGPDELVPADRLWTWNRDDAIKLRLGNSGPEAEKPISIPTMFEATVKKHPDVLALAHKRDGVWKKWTFKQYYDESWMAAKALIKLGVEPYHGVGIVGFNSPEWFIANHAAVFAGYAISCSVFTIQVPMTSKFYSIHCYA